MDINNVGGSASDSGFQFQAKIIAFIAVHILAKQVLTGLEYDIQGFPISVAAETNGPGDDIRIEFSQSTHIVEMQAKKGLRIDSRFNEAIEKIATGLRQDTISSVCLMWKKLTREICKRPFLCYGISLLMKSRQRHRGYI